MRPWRAKEGTDLTPSRGRSLLGLRVRLILRSLQRGIYLAPRRVHSLVPLGRRRLVRLEHLVDVEEVLDLAHDVRRKVLDRLHLGPMRVGVQNADDLGIVALLVLHPEDSHWAGIRYPAAGKRR